MQYTGITSDKLTLGLWHVVGKTAVRAWVEERYKHYTAVDKQSWMGAEGLLGEPTWEIARIVARKAMRIDLPIWLRSEP